MPVSKSQVARTAEREDVGVGDTNYQFRQIDIVADAAESELAARCDTSVAGIAGAARRRAGAERVLATEPGRALFVVEASLTFAEKRDANAGTAGGACSRRAERDREQRGREAALEHVAVARSENRHELGDRRTRGRRGRGGPASGRGARPASTTAARPAAAAAAAGRGVLGDAAAGRSAWRKALPAEGG